MKQFKFKLQTVHDLRESRLDSAERELASAMSNLYHAEAQLREINRYRQKALERYLLLYQSREIQVAEITAHSDFISSLTNREQQARSYVAETERQVAGKRQLVTEAMRATETTGKLRDRQRQRHITEVNRNQQASLDEMAVLAVARRRISNR